MNTRALVHVQLKQRIIFLISLKKIFFIIKSVSRVHFLHYCCVCVSISFILLSFHNSDGITGLFFSHKQPTQIESRDQKNSRDQGSSFAIILGSGIKILRPKCGISWPKIYLVTTLLTCSSRA